MRIVLVTDVEITGLGGGSLGKKILFHGIREWLSSHPDAELKVISPDKDLPEGAGVRLPKNAIIDSAVRALGRSSYVYWSFGRIKRFLKEYCPNCVILGRTRFGFLAKFIKKSLPACRVITYADNVELDYIAGYFAGKKGLVKAILCGLEKRAVIRDERQNLEYTDALWMLTTRDRARFQELYPHPMEGISQKMVCPVCAPSEITLSRHSEKKVIAFTGSLGYSSNLLAVTTLVKDIWIPYFSKRDDVELLIAGRHAPDSLIALCKSAPGCRLQNGFDTLEGLLPLETIFVAPLEKGAGMKLKVLDALCLGLPVIGSEEALVGYEEVCAEKCYVFHAEKPQEYADAINSLLGLNEEEFARISACHKALFRRFLSYERSDAVMGELLDAANRKETDND